jgi:hypothetical protein
MPENAASKSSSPEPEADEHGAATSVQPTEPKDPEKSGGDGSRQKSELKQNVQGGQAQRPPDTPAGQHATGSFPDPSEAPGKG